MSFRARTHKVLPKRCRRCGRELTDPKSIKKGIGPECEKNERVHGKGLEPAKLTEIMQQDEIWLWRK